MTLYAPQVKDLFEEKKRKAWKQHDTAEAQCDFSPSRMKITNHGCVFFITLWKKLMYRCTLTLIKGDDNSVPFIRSVLGSFLSPEDYAVVTTPKRRHKVHNFASHISFRIA